MNTVIVTGSRKWSDYELLCRVLDSVKPELLVEGGARGADYLASMWAMDRCVKSTTVYANWKAYGKRAGLVRNIEMLKQYPEALVVAFPLPQGTGTQHCIREAIKRKHKVMVVEPSGNWSVVTCKPKTS